MCGTRFCQAIFPSAKAIDIKVQFFTFPGFLSNYAKLRADLNFCVHQIEIFDLTHFFLYEMC